MLLCILTFVRDALAANNDSSNVQSVRSDDVSFRSWLLQHGELIIGAYLSALVLLAYPASLIVLRTQLAYDYGFGYWTALYAASLVPKTFVIGKVPLLIWTSLGTSIAVWAWVMFGWGWKPFARTLHRLPGDPFGFNGPDQIRNWRKIPGGQMLVYILRYTQLTVPLILPLVIVMPFRLFSWFGLGVYIAYLSLCFLGAFVAEPLVNRFYEDRSERRLYAVTVVAFIFGFLAAIPLASVEDPGLQTIEIGSGDELREVVLLSNSNGYWHVINHNQTIVSIPDHEAGTVRVIEGTGN
jgi:hypothetical protein